MVGTIRQQGTGVATVGGAMGGDERRGGAGAPNGQCDAGWHKGAKDGASPPMR